MNIGKLLRGYRKAKGLTREELAGSMGISEELLKKWEAKEENEDMPSLEVIANMIGTFKETLLSYDNELEN